MKLLLLWRSVAVHPIYDFCTESVHLLTATEAGQKRRKEDMPVFEQAENVENPLRCPVKLYEFYLSKWLACYSLCATAGWMIVHSEP